MSPQIAMVSRWIRPLARRMVSASSSACVGCSCRPSPAFSTAHSTFCARRFTAPDCAWRTTSRSGCMAFSVSAVSISVSPFFTEDAHRHVHHIRAKPLAGQLEGGLRAGGVLEEHVDLRQARQRVGLLGPCGGSGRRNGRPDRGRWLISSGASCSIPRRWRARKVMAVSWPVGSVIGRGRGRASGEGAVCPRVPAARPRGYFRLDGSRLRRAHGGRGWGSGSIATRGRGLVSRGAGGAAWQVELGSTR